MRLSDEEMEIFSAACNDPNNEFAQELMNVFGAEKAFQIIDHLPSVPLWLLVDVISHLWKALTYELQRHPQARAVGMR